jgi:hypothetical protein
VPEWSGFAGVFSFPAALDAGRLTAWYTATRRWVEQPGRFDSIEHAERAATDRGIYRVEVVCDGRRLAIEPFAIVGSDWPARGPGTVGLLARILGPSPSSRFSPRFLIASQHRKCNRDSLQGIDQIALATVKVFDRCLVGRKHQHCGTVPFDRHFASPWWLVTPAYQRREE